MLKPNRDDARAGGMVLAFCRHGRRPAKMLAALADPERRMPRAASPRNRKIYVQTPRIVPVHTDFLDRYACVNGRPLVRETVGRTASVGECHC